MWNKVLIFCLLLPCSVLAQQKLYERELLLMGTAFQISVIDESEDHANESIDAGIEEIQRIEDLISEWKETSETSEVNRNAGVKPVKVSPELFNLVLRSIKVSELTDGAFDITFAGMGDLYNFDKQEHALPIDSVIADKLETVGWEHIQLDKNAQTIYLSKPGMKIGFGAIGKGYAANKAKQLLKDRYNIENGVVNAAGDLNAWGVNIDKPWSIGIANPENHDDVAAWLEADNNSIVTSGNYEKYFTHNGRRFSHIIDPRTGRPASGLKSVTIITTDAELADALATAVFVMGFESGMDLIESLNGIECLLIDDDNVVWISKGLKPDNK